MKIINHVSVAEGVVCSERDGFRILGIVGTVFFEILRWQIVSTEPQYADEN